MSATAPPDTPAVDFAAFLRRFPHEMTFSDEAPVDIVDRYHTPQFVQYNDGMAIDRDALVAHARPARKNVVGLRVDVHETLVTGDRAAARYTLRADMRKGGVVETEIYAFARFAADGRVTRIDQITRDVSESAAAQDPSAAAPAAG